MVNSFSDSRDKLADAVLLFLYAVLFTILFIQQSMLRYSIVISGRIAIVISIAMLAISLTFKKHNIYDFFWLIVLLVIVLMNILQPNTDSSPLIFMTLIAFSLSNVRPRKVLSVSAVLISTLLLFVFILSKFGVISNLIFYRGEVSRQSLGMIYPLTFSGYLFFLAVAISILFGQKHSNLTALCLVVLCSITYFINQARNDSLMILLLIIAIYFSKYLPKVLQFFSKFYIVFMAFIALVTPFVTNLLKTGSPIYVIIDKLVSGRLYLQSELLSEFKPTLFGQYIYENGNGGLSNSMLPYFYIDSAFTKLLFLNGILFFIAFIFSWLIRIHSLNKSHFYFLTTIFVIVWIDGIAQESLQLPAFNILFGLLLTNVNMFNSISDVDRVLD